MEFAAIRLLTAAAYLDAPFREPRSRELVVAVRTGDGEPPS
jgi:hypothetical protein